MATLPRMNHSKHGNSISSPFSTSPRKLQEMTFPSPERCGHDITVASGMSMKQYQEQLTSLRSDNFQMKLRIYFLEEKLGSGAPPAVKGLLEHNVRLQVEVEELKRQLSEKQELLAAAAEAIDVLEHQGFTSAEGVETSMNTSVSIRKEMNEELKSAEDRREAVDDTYPESESAGDYLAITVNNDDLDQLTKLRKENHKALQMIKGCMKKIQQQEKEIKKLHSNKKELTFEHVSDSQLEKYEEILKWKDEHIRDLENRLKEFPQHIDNIQNDDASGNLQQLLTRRLQGLAYFLDKLLSHKCVLGEDKKKLAESILEQSLALPVGLKLDETMALEDFTLEESNLDSTQSLRLDDLTMMFGHHMTCNDDSKECFSRKLKIKNYPQADMISESDCWSEPDRNVSLARVGLCNTGVAMEEIITDNNSKFKSRRSRISYGSRTEDNKIVNESVFLEEIRELTNKNELLEIEKKDLDNKLEQAMIRINDLINDKDELTKSLAIERNNIIECNKNFEAMKTLATATESRLKESEQQLSYTVQLSETLRKDRQELESTFLENERSLRRAADEATVQASQAALERARAQHDRLQLERELEDVREELSAALDANAQLQMQLTRKVLEDDNKIAEIQEAAHSEEDRPTSPDQGIDSDRLSSLEQNDAITLSPRSLLQENIMLKEKLTRTKATLADTLTQLNAANMRKRSVQRAICREIHKTQGVLRKARDQLENNY